MRTDYTKNSISGKPIVYSKEDAIQMLENISKEHRDRMEKFQNSDSYRESIEEYNQRKANGEFDNED